MMHISASSLLALLASPLLVFAASSANPFNVPNGGYAATAGQPLQLTWNATTSGTVSLILRSGASSDLSAGTYIAQSISNSGSYTWTPDTSITRGSDYAVEIVDDSDPSETNYTPYFVIDSTNTVASSTSEITLGAATASAAMSSAVSSASTAATATDSVVSGTATGTSVSSAISSANSVASSASASASSELSSLSTAAASTTSGSASSASGATYASTSASASAATGGAPRATAAGAVMGLIALGAMAL